MLSEVVNQVPDAQRQANENDRHVELVPEIGEHFHVLSELDADPGQEVAPDQRTDEGEETENSEVGFEHPGRKRNKCADDRQHAADEKRPVSPAVDPFVGVFQIARADQNPFAVFFDERSSAEASQEVGGNRTEHAADSTGERRQVYIHFAFVNQNARGGHDGFAGQRNVGRLDCHHDDDAPIAPRSDGVANHLQNGIDELV